jgi:hypothetical protein
MARRKRLRRILVLSEVPARAFSLRPWMEPEIVPEPPEDERKALNEALARLLAQRPDPYSDWWRQGVDETVGPEDEPE